MEDITDSNNPLGSDVNTASSVVRLNDIVGPGFTGVSVEIEVAAIFETSGVQPDTYQTHEPLQVQYAYGGDSGGTAGTANPTLLGGSYTTVGQFGS